MAEKFNLEETAMYLIAHAGESKSLSFMALRAAKKGSFEEATKYIEEANKEMLKAHEIQTNLIVKEAGGEKIEIGLIMVHSQKHIMNAILFKDMAQEVIDNHLLFYLDDHTWIKVDDMTNDYLIRLQLLHLK